MLDTDAADAGPSSLKCGAKKGIPVRLAKAKCVAKRLLTHDGRTYRLHIFGQGPYGRQQRRYVALCRTGKRLIQTAAVANERSAQILFVRLIDPKTEIAG